MAIQLFVHYQHQYFCRESLLLFEDGMSSKKSMQSIATVVAHELAHQWFGNLVTPSWWTDLWLNEGFATYVEYIGTDAVSSRQLTLLYRNWDCISSF